VEEQWDFAFVQVSTDGGATYTSVVCDDSRSDVVPDGHPTVKANLPGFTGVSDWKTETCDLSAYAGQTVTLAFRYVTDWRTAGNTGAPFAPGWWIDDVVLDGTGVTDGTSLTGWKSFTQQRPTPVPGWTVQLVGYRSDGRTPAVIGTIPLGPTFAGTLDRGTLERLLGGRRAAGAPAPAARFRPSAPGRHLRLPEYDRGDTRGAPNGRRTGNARPAPHGGAHRSRP